MSSLLISFISKIFFSLSPVSIVFVHCQTYIFFNVALVVVVVVVEAVIGSVELQRERKTHCQQCRASETLTARSKKK